MAFIPDKEHGKFFGRATWYPIPVTQSLLCSAGCSQVTGNTVYQNRVMGIYLQSSSPEVNSYLAIVPRR
jgi:parallel beta-helix repeat protein